MSKVKARIIRFLVFGSLALFLTGAYVLMTGPQSPPTGSHQSTQSVAGVKIGGPYTLTDHTGKSVTEKDFQDKYKLIYFGFTYCPAVCPTELQKMAKALEILGPLADKIHPLFITVDPERDSVDVMSQYVAHFHPDLIGLTGTPSQIQSVLKDYKIYAARVEDEDASDYTMDHSSFIYLMSPEDNLLHIFRTQDSAEDIAVTTNSALSETQG